MLVSELLAELSPVNDRHTKTEQVNGSGMSATNEHKELTFLNGQKAPSLVEEETRGVWGLPHVKGMRKAHGSP